MKIRFLVVAVLVAGGVIIASPLAPAQDGAAPAATAPAAEWLPSNTILPTGQVVLPDGWKISPVGRTVELPGDMPNRMLLTPDQKYLLVSTGGYNEHGLTVLDARTLAKVDHSAVPQTFSGLCTDAAGQHVLLSPGGSAAPATLYSFALHDGHLKAEPGLDVPAIPKSNRFIGGVVQDAGGTTYIADINADTIYRAVPGGQPATSAKVGYRPCALALSPDGALLAVANWGEQSVALLKAADLAPQARLAVGSHPADGVRDRFCKGR